MPVNVCVASMNRANTSRPLRPGGAVGTTTGASVGADVVGAADAADAAVGTVVAGPPAGEQPTLSVRLR